MAKEVADPAMKKVVRLFEKSGLSLQELGLKMEYPAKSARKSAWQFIQRTADPRASMLRRFAKAMGVDVKALL